MQEDHTHHVILKNRPPRLQAQGPRIAYLLSQYPAVSHTFFLKEILGLKQLGFQVETASINPADRAFDQLPAREAEESRTTYYVKTLDAKQIFKILPLLVLRNLGVCARGLRAALRLSRWDLRASLYSLLYL